jgi:hypothetical protein
MPNKIKNKKKQIQSAKTKLIKWKNPLIISLLGALVFLSFVLVIAQISQPNSSKIAEAKKPKSIQQSSVTFSYPRDGQTISTKNRISLRVYFDRTSRDNIRKVEFYANDLKIGETTDGSDRYRWPAPDTGNYTLKAKATTKDGSILQASPVRIKVLNTNKDRSSSSSISTQDSSQSSSENQNQSSQISNNTSSTIANQPNSCANQNLVWQGGFNNNNWNRDWNLKSSGQFGQNNQNIINDSTYGNVLRVGFPRGSVTPSYSRQTGAPVGGTQFLSTLPNSSDKYCLSYDLKFKENFQFVKGGKLPGLYAGSFYSGNNIPDGTNGFSTRYMWRTNGSGEVYAYLPTNTSFGASLGRGDWTFKTGTWQNITQEITMNTPGQRNGIIRVWLDNTLVYEKTDTVFRTTNNLKIEGVLFSTFFGGSDRTWASTENTYIDFANFKVYN